MAKVLLVQAAVHDTHVERAYPLALMSLASHVRAVRGDAVEIHDMRLHWREHARPVEHFRRFRPDAVGISAHGVDAPSLHRVAADFKAISPGTPIVCGGIHATSYWREVLADRHVDVVAIGEGEHTFAALLTALESGAALDSIPGIAFRRNGSAASTGERDVESDLDRFPAPAWDLVDVDAYGRFPRPGLFYRDRRYMCIETARGCPYHCAWCHRSMGGTFRPHSPEYVLEMLTALAKDHGVRDFLVVDDMFNLDPERIERIFEGVIARDLRAGFTLPIGIRADIMSNRTLALMARAGVYKLMIAVETASERLQRKMGKNLDLGRTREVIAQANALGIATHGNFMIGLPDETPAEAWETLRFAARSRLATFGLYRAIPFKGTRLHEWAVRDGRLPADEEQSYSFWDLDVNVSHIPSWKLLLIRRVAYPYFYLRPSRVARIVRRTPSKARLIPFFIWFFFKKLAGT